jgi:hypothetical protein
LVHCWAWSPPISARRAFKGLLQIAQSWFATQGRTLFVLVQRGQWRKWWRQPVPLEEVYFQGL